MKVSSLTTTGAVALLLSGCAGPMQMGDPGAKTVATGSAGGANAQLEHCDKALGTMTIVEEANQPWLDQFTQEYHVQSTVPLLRMIIQQSNRFVVVERGRAFNNMQGERALMASGALRKTSNLGKGQMVAAALAKRRKERFWRHRSWTPTISW